MGTEDVEHPRGPPQGSALLLQQDLTKIADRCVAAGLVERMRSQERWDDLHRLEDLSSLSVNHEWLWAVHKHKTSRLEADDEFVAAVRLRLGCAGPVEPVQCRCCGTATLGCSGIHGLLCAPGESTRGHNAIRDELHSMAIPIDSAAETEPEGLIPSRPFLRPADVLTGAFHHGRLAAVDVGVICPSASGAGSDCVVTMDQRKRARIHPFSDQLEAGGVDYQTFIVSCWGRLHPAAMVMLTNAAKRTARRRGYTCYRAVLQGLVARIVL